MQQIDRTSVKKNPSREKQRQPGTPFRIPKSDQELIDKIFNQSRPEWHNLQTGFASGPNAKRQHHEMIIWSWLAALIDGLVVIAASCFFVITISFLMRTPVSAILKNLFIPGNALLLFVQLFAVTSWMYMVITRAFMGFTFGEMSCDIRLGQPNQRLKASYLPKVIIRQTLFVFTGIFLFPIFSILTGQDVAGSLIGLKLYSIK